MIKMSNTPTMLASHNMLFFIGEFFTYNVAEINARNADAACINPSIIPNPRGIMPNAASVKKPAETKIRNPWVICKCSCERLKNARFMDEK